ncbi:hypothetical protein FGSG_07847 [Fusarium graminearum PH-1]|uniref:Fungal N-terminal domain-containing protein n=2 Tax=Gibberella zeae TaxID=5518 RepID=I1RUF6_GIBZE|nr:hypothetical protein FGSG_07847 [Fusarium graminearum PH-1]ESU14165.1 hypothetical protein FGSG_07847 [Fusarium graminearum PH-1]EYB33610.1 hypothetical protein FG05_07847 [Fusarium graminearum]CAF3494955.1 unnamed protein product [Fusarium graminearum]|eukprot:XP_011327672.1 hypothetical protein FGSG_07847 [Fusarium graminearum PH-1]
MDGLSIATACFAFIEIADKTFTVISDFVRDCKDARNDLAALNQELLSLKRTLNLLKDLVTDGNESDLTNNTKRDIRDIIQNSLGIASTLENELRGQQGRLLAVHWATRGKRKVATYQVILETNRRALSLAVETITLATAKNIKQDTTEILDDTAHIRGGITSIISRIQTLEAIVTSQGTGDPHTFMLTRYLNELSSVAGSVCDPLSRSTSPAPSESSSTSAASYDSGVGEGSQPVNTPSGLPTDKDVPPVSESEASGKSPTDLANDPFVLPDSFPVSVTEACSLENLAFQLRQSHFLSKHLQIEQETYPTGLSSDGNRLVWLQPGKKHDVVYDTESKRINNVMSMGTVDRFRQSIHKTEMRILNTDASLILFKISKSCWKVYDRVTGKTIRQDFFNSLATWTQQIVPVSKDCGLLLLGHYRKGYTLNRIRRSSRGAKGLVWNYKVLPSSGDSILHHVTLSVDSQNVTGLLGDAQQLAAYTWDIPSEWFADEHIVVFPYIGSPVTVDLHQEDLKNHERTLGLTSTRGRVIVIKGGVDRRTSYHAGFRNTYLSATTFNIDSGAEISSYSFSVSRIHGDDNKDSFFKDAKISADGKLLRTRIARTPGIGKRSTPEFKRQAWIGVETVILRVEGLEVVHQFKEVWNANFTEPVTLSIFAPNFDVLARLAWKRRGEDKKQRVWLEVYDLKENLEEDEAVSKVESVA